MQAQILQTALQLTNTLTDTQIFHCPMCPAAAGVIPKAGERGSFLLCSAVPSCFSCRKILRLRLHSQTQGDEAAIENVYQMQ